IRYGTSDQAAMLSRLIRNTIRLCHDRRHASDHEAEPQGQVNFKFLRIGEFRRPRRDFLEKYRNLKRFGDLRSAGAEAWFSNKRLKRFNRSDRLAKYLIAGMLVEQRRVELLASALRTRRSAN